jgi:hypothetical protein
MGVATISPAHDHSRFEIHSRVSSAVPKIIVKSAHRGEVARWIQAIKLNIEYYSKNPPDRQPKRSTSLNATTDRPAAGTISAMPPTDSFLSPVLQRSTTGLTGGSIAQPPGAIPRRDSSPANTAAGTDEAETISIFEAADDRSVLDAAEGSEQSGVPHQASFDLSLLNIKAQLELTSQLVDSLVTPPSSGTSSDPHSMVRTPSRQQAVKDALKQSLSTLSTMTSQQHVMTQDRERYFMNRIAREVDARRLWEENMLTVAKQQADMDRQLTEAAQHNDKKRRALRQAKEVLAGISAAGSLPVSPAAEESPAGTPGASGILDVVSPPPASALSAISFRTAATHRQSISISNVQEVHAALQEAESEDEEDDDEFFDAIEQGTIPGLKLHDSIAHPETVRPGTPTALNENKAIVLEVKEEPEKGTIKAFLSRKSLEPYLHVRNRLPIDDDKRPSVSCKCIAPVLRAVSDRELMGLLVWSILKSSVGKDLTKISFPVSFNECTSMLQRMGECDRLVGMGIG